jgi:protein-S-isoprenylcysteine O-methyltransferase Ste14
MTTLELRAGALYLPVVTATLAALLRRPGKRLAAGCLLSFLWAVTALLILERLNQTFGWWRFTGGDVWFCGMPLELYLGWAVLWGLVPQLLLRRMALANVAVVMGIADLWVMPLCRAIAPLSDSWLVGEAAALVLVLLPAIAVARWTAEDTHLRVRVSMQVAISGMLFLGLLPEIAFALRPGGGWAPLLATPGWLLQIELQGIGLLAVPGLAAVMEFCDRGDGAPIPFDPPKRLVTCGVYRYVANPMQMSCTAVMLVWAVVLRSGWYALASALALVYGAGLAAWDERADLSERFGEPWRAYRAEVKDWRVRWKPYHAGAPARLYIARTCGPCSELRRWIEVRGPAGLELVDAETLAAGSIRRMRYEVDDERLEGIRALGRALEHLNAGWAFCGAVLRMPGVWQVVQLVMDASGLGPRELGVGA